MLRFLLLSLQIFTLPLLLLAQPEAVPSPVEDSEDTELLSSSNFEPVDLKLDLSRIEALVNALHYRSIVPIAKLKTLETGSLQLKAVWDGNKPELKTALDSYKLYFQPSIDGTGTYREFSLAVEFLERKMVVKSSNPRFAKERFGVRFGFRRGEVVSVFLHAAEVPGTVLIIPIRESAELRSLVFCPRFPPSRAHEPTKERIHSYYLEDAQVELSGIEGDGSASISSRIFSGLGFGFSQAEIVASPHFPWKGRLVDRVVDKDPAVRLIYDGEGEVPDRSSLSKPARATLTAGLFQRNSAGFQRKITKSHILWVKKVKLSPDLPVDYSGQVVGVGPGACYAVVEDVLLSSDYSRVER